MRPSPALSSGLQEDQPILHPLRDYQHGRRPTGYRPRVSSRSSAHAPVCDVMAALGFPCACTRPTARAQETARSPAGLASPQSSYALPPRRFMGPNYSISTACATANYCYNSAAMHIRNGVAMQRAAPQRASPQPCPPARVLIRVPCSRARRRRGPDHSRWCGGPDHRGWAGRLRGLPRAIHAQRRAGEGVPAVGQGP